MNSSLVIEEHRFRSEFLWLTVRLNVDTGACATKQKRSPARWPFVFIKSYYPPCKNFNARGQANIFKPPLCTKRFSFAFSLSLPHSLSLSLSLSFSLSLPLLSFCPLRCRHWPRSTITGNDSANWLFRRNNVSAWNYDSPFRQDPIQRNTVCTLFVRAKNG